MDQRIDGPHNHAPHARSMKATERTAAKPQRERNAVEAKRPLGRSLWLVVDNNKTKPPQKKVTARLIERAFAFLEADKFDEALAECDRAIELERDFAQAHIYRSLALGGASRFDEAAEACEQAIELDPGDAWGHAILAGWQLETGRYKESIAECDIALELIECDLSFAYETRNESINKLGLYQNVDEYIIQDYTGKDGGPVGNKTAQYFAVAAKAKEKGLSVAELEEAIENKLAAKAAARETTTRATVTPRPDAPAPSDAAQEMTMPATVTARLDDATVKAAAKVLASARKEKPGPRGPRHTLDPRLPKEAPEIYHDRKRRPELGGKKENVIQFVQRVYKPWLDILTRADLRILDETADKAVENYISAGKKLPQGLLLTESELTGEGRAATRGAPKLREGTPAPT
jgi:tetratricopeptide (TPR) repeat protein